MRCRVGVPGDADNGTGNLVTNCSDSLEDSSAFPRLLLWAKPGGKEPRCQETRCQTRCRAKPGAQTRCPNPVPDGTLPTVPRGWGMRGCTISMRHGLRTTSIGRQPRPHYPDRSHIPTDFLSAPIFIHLGPRLPKTHSSAC
jgi:hypothetical protein